uniref:Uncharacterized protein n=1 Tax=Rhizophora mucronata TaxID=61149 RepID=A0A2P2PX52_RHIMU
MSWLVHADKHSKFYLKLRHKGQQRDNWFNLLGKGK